MCCERLKIKRFCYKRVFIDLSKISKNGIARILKIKNKSFMSLSQDEKNNVISNYLYLFNLANADIKDIEKRVASLRKVKVSNSINKKYEEKRICYFVGINERAKSEIYDYVFDTMHILACKYSANPIKIQRNNNSMLDLQINMRYGYSFFNRYYHSDYDFGTEVKFSYYPDVDLLDEMNFIQSKVELKERDFEKYKTELDQGIIDKDMISRIYTIIQCNYALHKRKELFESLAVLYTNSRYTAFCVLGLIEIEGVFDDCCEIMNRYDEQAKINHGTLVEKANKLMTNEKLRQRFYPYFAFDLPIQRNQVAHKGIITSSDIKFTANEIMMDLWTIIRFAVSLENDKFFPVDNAYDEVQKQPEEKPEEVVFWDLFSSYQLKSDEYLYLLANTQKYEKELDFRRSLNSDMSVPTSKEKTAYISSVVKSGAFWQFINTNVVGQITTYDKSQPYNLAVFLEELRNIFIPVLPKDSPEKKECIKLSKALKQVIR